MVGFFVLLYGRFTCNSILCSKLIALGRPSRDEKATLPSRNGDISLYSLVHRARDSSSPFFTDKKSGSPYVSRHVALHDYYFINSNSSGIKDLNCDHVKNHSKLISNLVV